jgi:hypothetical protein
MQAEKRITGFTLCKVRIMKRTEMISSVVKEVSNEMYEYLLSGMDWMSAEVLVNGGAVQVYIHEVPAACEIADVQVIVLHDENEHNSPLLEDAIIKALPDWYDMKHSMEMEGVLTA